jgi:V/A-type H+-transporting ATPase subunit I
MIMKMSRVRILGPRERHQDVVRSLQDLGLIHLASPAPVDVLEPARLTARQERERRHLARILEDLEAALAGLRTPDDRRPRRPPPERPSTARLARWARLARRLQVTLGRLDERSSVLEEERALLGKYRGFLQAFEGMLKSQPRWPNATAFYVILRAGQAESLRDLRRALAAMTGDAFELRTQALPTGETILLVVVPRTAARAVERALSEARVEEIPVPAAFSGLSLIDAAPRMIERLQAIPRLIEEVRREREGLARDHGAELQRARRGVLDRLGEFEALPKARLTPHAFVLEGWLPAEAAAPLQRHLQERFGETLAVVETTREEWTSEEAPVVLANPRLFRPFEFLTRALPLPRYGTIDPTPFVAVFFPAFFGLMLGDVAYGAVLALLALAVRLRSRPGSVLRPISEIAGACAAFGILFGLVFGEFLGDFGRRTLGLPPALLSREEAVLPFLGLAVAIGAVHVLLGLGLGAVSALRRGAG